MQAALQAALQAAEHAGACSLAASPSMFHAARSALRVPPTPAPPGKRLSCIQRLLDGGEAAASPVPGRANLGLVEQGYKYLPLRDPVMQPRSRKGKRCPPAGLRASVPAQRSPVAPSPLMSWFMARAPGCRAQRWLAQQWADHVGKHRRHFCHQHRKWQMPAPRIPHLPPSHPKPSFTSTPKPTWYKSPA